jgi:hypothetical protein
MSSTSTLFKRGDLREDGKIFWSYFTDRETNKATREHWIYPEQAVAKYCSTICAAAKQRARKGGYTFDITPEYLVSIFPRDLMCPILQYKMHLWGEDKNRRPSLDKINPNLGYVHSNVAWISLEANRIKDNATIEVLRRLTAYMVEAQEQ